MNNKTFLKEFDIYTLNKKLPIRLAEVESIIDRIHYRYPILSKSEISQIVKKFFEEIREQLLLGNIVNIEKFLYGMNLFTYCKLRLNKISINTKINISTPKKIKKHDK